MFDEDPLLVGGGRPGPLKSGADFELTTKVSSNVAHTAIKLDTDRN